MSSMIDYDEQITSILASRVSKEVARRHLRIKRISPKLIFVKLKDRILDVAYGFCSIYYFYSWNKLFPNGS